MRWGACGGCRYPRGPRASDSTAARRRVRTRVLAPRGEAGYTSHMPETEVQGQPEPKHAHADPPEPDVAPRLCGLAVASLAVMGAWAASQVALGFWELPAVPVLSFAVVGLSFVLPTIGAISAVLALSRIAHGGNRMGGGFLAVSALVLGATVGAIQTVCGRPIAMLGCVLAAVVAVAVYGETERVARAGDGPRARHE